MNFNRFGEIAADKLAQGSGSWSFILSFCAVMAAWLYLNGYWLPAHHIAPFDPGPYGRLNLILSCLAAVQAPIIMMSQNRQEAREKSAAQERRNHDIAERQEREKRQQEADTHMLNMLAAVQKSVQAHGVMMETVRNHMATVSKQHAEILSYIKKD